MRRAYPSRLVLAAVCVSLLAPPVSPVFASQPERRAERRLPRVTDGEATAQACRVYGYEFTGNDRNRGGRHPAMALNAPPPPPPASVGPRTRVEEVTVTARKREDRLQDVPMAGAAVGGVPSQPTPSPKREDRYAYAPPAPRDTERYPDAATNSVKRVADDPVSTFSIDVDTAAYANVRRFLNDGQTPPRDAVRVEELVNYFDYAYPLPDNASEPFRATTAVVPSPWSRGKQIVHIGLQGYDLSRSEKPALNLVFLVDTSGSMWGEDRLPLAKKALNILISELRPQDRVSIVAYAGSAGQVLAPTPGTDRLRMRCALEALNAGGSTAGGQGLSLAYNLAQRSFRKGAANRVILMTDGDFNVGISDPKRLEDFVAEKRKTGIYLSVYGFGRGNYQDVMMQTLAQAGNGTAAYVDSLTEANKLFHTDFSRGLFPIADDVKIQVEFNPNRVSEYRLIGYETRLLAREDFNNDQVDAGEVGSGAAVTALYEITPVGGASAVDPLRYQSERPAAAPRRGGDELAFLKVRYKLPGEPRSRLMQQPISERNTYASLDRAPDSTRWAVAVAAYGQLLRRDPWMGERFNWSGVQNLAERAQPAGDPALRREFLDLVRRAREVGDDRGG
jgi:Ca-activated chloride channel family protein